MENKLNNDQVNLRGIISLALKTVVNENPNDRDRVIQVLNVENHLLERLKIEELEGVEKQEKNLKKA